MGTGLPAEASSLHFGRVSLLNSMRVTTLSSAACRWELKFRAKYHGTAALELGLTPEQLMLLERYADGLRHGGSSAPPEVRPYASWQWV